MRICFLTVHRTGEFWTDRHSMVIGSGQRYAAAVAFWWDWLFPATWIFFYPTMGGLLGDIEETPEHWLSGFSGIQTQQDDDDWGWSLEISDEAFEVHKAGVVGAGRKFWQIGSGQEYCEVWVLPPGEYYFEEIDEWLNINFFVFRLFRSDGSNITVYTHDGFFSTAHGW